MSISEGIGNLPEKNSFFSAVDLGRICRFFAFCENAVEECADEDASTDEHVFKAASVDEYVDENVVN